VDRDGWAPLSVSSDPNSAGGGAVTVPAPPDSEEVASRLTDEAGTAPGDRRFRPDVEGLRAVAVTLVVLYHGGLTGLSGGYIGVDVFFVISGFVITGVLLRERDASGRTSLLNFYGRRSRRIIPAATLVIVATVVATYAVVGAVFGNQTAVDARWTAVFLANFHFAAVGTDYLSAHQPPSPLLNFWSLAVEEQFYLVYPTVFLAIGALRSRWSLAVRLTFALSGIVIASFTMSVVQTASNPSAAYFSPFTRAWELALGALVAVNTPWLLRLPGTLASTLTWLGLVAIGYSAVAFDGQTAYPGSLVAIPVVGAALVIAGGASRPPAAAESLLRLAPFRWLGMRSYSLYLWHWPILILAADAAGSSSLPLRKNVLWLLVAVAASSVTFSLVENPVRHARLHRLGRWAPILLGLLLILGSVGVATVELDAHGHSTTPAPVTGGGTGYSEARIEAFLRSNVAADSGVVERSVGRAAHIRSLPTDLTPSLAGVSTDFGGPAAPCWPSLGQTSIPPCVFGDPHGTRTMVVYGDSHAAMWFSSFDLAASLAHWRLFYLGKGDCPADALHYGDPPGWGPIRGQYTPCDQWHRFAVARIHALRPDLVVITQEFRGRPDGIVYSSAQWQQGLVNTVRMLDVPARHVVVLGNTPILRQPAAECLSLHPSDVQSCSSPNAAFEAQYNRAERAAAAEVGAKYVSVLPWFCSTICTPVIGKYVVYWDKYHITGSYGVYLARVVGQAVGVAF
jgi:peptidoglycan/LPS O-acetylase OafA/YrhL